ncbi:hypothetical protein BKA70DRAFT_1430345 [Coprinopsis sp. MPI-PUGE-AT-0042]|nr:hypothetical protein BKA70DRAFT_1430345 [Coprinopsis sp. MPI-PUGE-AT-0042]
MDVPVPQHRLDLYRCHNSPLSDEGQAMWEADMAYLQSGSAALAHLNSNIDQEIREAEQHLWQLQRVRQMLKEDAKSLSEASEIVHRAGGAARYFPNELIMYIFRHCACSFPLEHADRANICNLASASRRFRGIALSLPELWSSVRINTHLLDNYAAQVLPLMRRAGGRPTTLVVDSGLLTGSRSDFANWLWMRESLLSPDNVGQQVFDGLAMGEVMIDHLQLGHDVLTDVGLLCSSGQGRLSLSLHWRKAIESSVDHNPNIPRPRRLSFSKSHPNLQSLQIYEQNPAFAPPTFGDLVPHHTNLASLHLHDVQVTQSSQWAALASALPLLKNLLLNRVQFPSETVTLANFLSLTHVVVVYSLDFYSNTICPHLEFLSAQLHDTPSIVTMMDNSDLAEDVTLVIFHRGLPFQHRVEDLIHNLDHSEQLLLPMYTDGVVQRQTIRPRHSAHSQGPLVSCLNVKVAPLCGSSSLPFRDMEDLVDMVIDQHPIECGTLHSLLWHMFF